MHRPTSDEVKIALLISRLDSETASNAAKLLALEVIALQATQLRIASVMVALDASATLMESMRLDPPIDGTRPFAAAAAVVARENIKQLIEALKEPS